MKKLLSLVPLLMAVISFCFAQKTSKALHVGDQMPSYRFQTVVNSKQTTIDLKEYRGKYLILDFWNTRCAGCIRAFPHMQELSSKFKNKLNIVLVDDNRDEKIEDVNKILTRYKTVKNINISLPIALNVGLLNSYFPHKGVPHEVIIDPNGKICAITDLNEISKEKIAALLSGARVSFFLKDDFWSTNLPFVAINNSSNTNGIITSSSIIEGISNDSRRGGQKVNEKREIIGALSDRTQLLTLYRDAYQSDFWSCDTTIYETKNPAMIPGESGTPKDFRYDLIVPAGQYTLEKYRQCLKQDLDRSFDFSFRKKKISVPCLIIKTNSNISLSYTKYDKTESNADFLHNNDIDFLTKTHTPVYYHNIGSDWIDGVGGSDHLYSLFNAFKTINEASTAKNIDLDFPAGFDFKNKEKLVTFLHEKGIDITVENRDIDALIVSDKKPGDPTILP